MKILLFGSTGMLGQALCNEAKQKKYEVIGVARNQADICADITEDEEVYKIIADTKPDLIINAAAMISLKGCAEHPGIAYLTNARSVSIMAQLADLYGAYFIHISTDHYYSGEMDKKHKEQDVVSLINEYSRSKYAGEAFALTNKNALVVRTNIVGYRYQPHALTFVEWVVYTLKNELPLTMFNDYYTSSIDVCSFTQILLDLIDKKISGLINIGSRDVISKRAFIERLANTFELSLNNAVSGSVKAINDGIQRAESLGLDVSLAESLLNYSMPDSDNVIERLAFEYKRGFF